MLEKTVTKLWQGRYCSVRDYEVKKAISKGGLIVKHKDKSMKVYPSELQKLKATGQAIQSNYKGTYKLIDILFKPDEDNRNADLFKE